MFLTTTNLTSNPRLSKEILILGNKEKIIAIRLHNWSKEIEKRRINQLPGVAVTYLDASRKNWILWLQGTFLQILASWLIRISNSGKWLAFSLDKRSWLLDRYLNSHHITADYIVAHNPGALYPAYAASKRWNIPFQFDVEDFHPGEGIPREAYDPATNSMAKLMEKLLPHAERVTFASPMIMEETLKLCRDIKNPTVINNCFPQDEFTNPAESTIKHFSTEASEKAEVNISTTRLSLVWYSQNINHSRGLESLIEALQTLRRHVNLTLIGYLHEPFARKWIGPNEDFIETIDPLPQKELHQSLVNYDVGLALEMAEFDFNRDLCLTNKIWAYLQAGLYILATDTAAQTTFLREHADHGILTSPSPSGLQRAVEKLIEEKEQIRRGMSNRYDVASSFAWEHEAEKLNLNMGAKS